MVLKTLMKLIAVKTIAGLAIRLIIAGGIGYVVYSIFRMLRKEDYTIMELAVPPLDKLETNEYAYGCPINGYRCEPSMIYKIELQGKGIFKHLKYVKYKLVDSENIVRYSGLYKNLEGVKVGSYVTFDNGQEYIITSLDTVNVPTDCPTVRRDKLME